MAEPLRPTPAKVFGRENWIYVQTIAITTAPTATEINAASALDITNIAFADGAPTPGQNTNLVDQNRRFGDTTTSQFVGVTTYQGGEMRYQLDPQAAGGSNGKKAWEKFLNTSGTITGFLVRRQNVARATAVAAGQFVDVYPVEFGPSMPVTDGDQEAAEAAAMCTFAITSAPSFLATVA